MGRWLSQLTTFPICYTPLQVSHQDKLGDDGAEFSPFIPLHRCLANDKIRYKSMLIPQHITDALSFVKTITIPPATVSIPFAR